MKTWLLSFGAEYFAFQVAIQKFKDEDIRGWIQNFPDWCRHLHSICVSAKHP